MSRVIVVVVSSMLIVLIWFRCLWNVSMFISVFSVIMLRFMVVNISVGLFGSVMCVCR